MYLWKLTFNTSNQDGKYDTCDTSLLIQLKASTPLDWCGVCCEGCDRTVVQASPAPRGLHCGCPHGVRLRWHGASAPHLSSQPWHSSLWPRERAQETTLWQTDGGQRWHHLRTIKAQVGQKVRVCFLVVAKNHGTANRCSHTQELQAHCCKSGNKGWSQTGG